MEEREKLKILLEHWIEHNGDHSEKFREWAEKAKCFGEDAVRDNILKAAQQLEGTNEFLAAALEKLTAEDS